MNNKQSNLHIENDFGICHLIFTLWKQKIIIIMITIIAIILSGVYSMLILTPIYNSSLNIIINMPDEYITKYGEYTLPISSNQQYINLILSDNVIQNTITDMNYDSVSVEDLKEKINIRPLSNASTENEQNSFVVVVSAENAEEAYKLGVTLYSNYTEFLDIITMESIYNFYSEKFTALINQLNYSIISNNELLVNYEKLLADIPQTINHEEALKDIKASIGGNDILILDDVSNPNYISLENDVIGLKKSIESNKNSIALYNQYLDDIEVQNTKIKNYYESGNIDLRSIGSSIVATGVSLPSSPIIPSRKSGPSNTKNIILGTFLGVLIGCFVVIIKEYWSKFINR